MDHDKGDWEHEVKRDKALDKIAELEARNKQLTASNQGLTMERNALQRELLIARNKAPEIRTSGVLFF